jgi:hypothetical protein
MLLCHFCVRVCWGSHYCFIQLLPRKHVCLQSRYLATAVVYLLIPQSLPSNGSTCHNNISYTR